MGWVGRRFVITLSRAAQQPSKTHRYVVIPWQSSLYTYISNALVIKEQTRDPFVLLESKCHERVLLTSRSLAHKGSFAVGNVNEVKVENFRAFESPVHKYAMHGDDNLMWKPELIIKLEPCIRLTNLVFGDFSYCKDQILTFELYFVMFTLVISTQ